MFLWYDMSSRPDGGAQEKVGGVVVVVENWFKRVGQFLFLT